MSNFKAFPLGLFLSLLFLVAATALRAQTVNSIPLSSLPQNSRLMIWGDSVTEVPAWYPRYIEGYLLMSAGRTDVKVMTVGHSGATLGETLTRQIDLQAFNPTVVQFFYGFNDISFGETSSQWDSTMQSVLALYKGKGITAICAGPGWTDGDGSGNPTTEQQTINTFNSIAHTDVVNAGAGAYDSDIADRTAIALKAAVAAYGNSYTIGVHYTPNGAICAAYEDIKTLGNDGNIGTVSVDMAAGTATASTGHTVVSYANRTVVLDSSKYPFCYNFDPNEYQGTTGIASMLPYLPFSQDLNRFVLTVTNLGAASANVTWGSQTKTFTSAQLAAGVNLADQFTSTPFDVTFAQVMAAIVNKELFEGYEVKGTSNYFGNDNGGNVDQNMRNYQASLDTAVKALIVPVRHTISIVPAGASTAVAPVIIGTMMAYPQVGQSFSYQVSVLNGANSYALTGNLPNGLNFSTTTGQITGTPTATGVSAVTLTATNSHDTSLATKLTLTVQNPIPAVPTINSPTTATATVGVPFSYQITATNNPTNFFASIPSNVGTEGNSTAPYTFPSLPPGLVYDTTTGIISGTPTVAGTYNFELAAVNAGGLGVTSESPPGLALTVNPSGGTAPPAPTGLAAASGSGQVTLTWSASAGAATYSVFRGPSTGTESPTAIASGISSTSYTDTGVTNGTTYYYEVKAVNAGLYSPYSNESSATPVLGIPSAPTNLTANGGNAQVTLSWTAGAGAATYNIYRGTLANGENTTPIATGVTSTSYTDTGLLNGPTFYYKVVAVNAAGKSGYSNEASAATSAGGGSGKTTYYQDSFNRSGDMTGSAPDAQDTGSATWGNLAGTGQYPISGGTAAIAPTAYAYSAEYLPVNGTSGITLDGTKDFTLSVAVTSGASGLTGIALSTVAPGNVFDHALAALATSSGFAGAYSFNGGLINYNFAPGITGQTTISLAYSAAAGTITYMVGTTNVSTQTGVTAAEIASIRYVALGDDGYGGTASSPAATPAPTFDNFIFSVGNNNPPAAPTNVMATASNGEIFLTWTASAGATSYTIYRGTSSGNEGMTPLASGITSTSYTDASAVSGQSYYYQVVAVNGAGSSGDSTEIPATDTSTSTPEVATDTPTLPQWALLTMAGLLIYFAGTGSFRHESLARQCQGGESNS